MSPLDGFLRYNLIMVSHFDQMMTFCTKRGTYAYRKIPFGLINISATFQWAMDVSYNGIINKSMVVYLDDVTMFSKKIGDHLKKLWHIFNRFHKYGISLNTKKSIFIVIEGKILGHVISKDGILIDPERIEAIIAIVYFNNKKTI